MRGKIGAALAAVAAAVGTVGAATWARRRQSHDDLDLEVSEAPAGKGADRTSAASTSAEAAADAVAAGRKAGDRKAAAEGGAGGEASAEDAGAEGSQGAGAAEGAADDLTAIKGLGKVKVAKLMEMGITSYAQIAAWTEEDIADVGLKVNTSPGQIKREDWVGQAKALAGD